MLSIREEDGALWVVPPSTTDVAEMRRARQMLRTRLDAYRPPASSRARVVFDMRSCTLGMPQLWFTVRTLLRYEAYMACVLERSAALVPHNRAVKALSDVFLSLYTPVRPFSIEVDEAAARAFVAVSPAEPLHAS